MPWHGFCLGLYIVLNIHISSPEKRDITFFPLNVMCAHALPSCVQRGLGYHGGVCVCWGGERRIARELAEAERSGEAGDRRAGGLADCYSFEPNRWWRLGDVPSPGLSPVIEDNLSTKESRPVHCQAQRGETGLIWKWFCITTGFVRLAAILILAWGSGNEEVSPWVQAPRHAHEYISNPWPCAPH